MLARFFFTFTIMILAMAYIDFDMTIASAGSDIAFNCPFTIGKTQYSFAVSLSNQPEYITVNGKHKNKNHKIPNKPIAHFQVSSLEGYTFEGWKRYFMEVLLFVEQKKTHQILIDLSPIKKNQKVNSLSDGVMTLGPDINNNKIYGLIKNQMTDFIHEDIVGFFSAAGGKVFHMQLGGYQQVYARGHKNGVLFYEKMLTISDDSKRWMIAIEKLLISRQNIKKWQTFILPSSSFTAYLSIQSQFLVLPAHLLDDLETSLFSQHVECSMKSQLQCSNISSIDQALTFISLALDDGVYLNISLYELRDNYDSHQKITTYFLKLGKEDQLQIGSVILKNYYIALNLTKPSLLFSPLNRFPSDITSVSILRFFIIFLVFMLVACIGVIIWQQFNDPQHMRRRRIERGKEGVRLVAYQRATLEDDD